MTPHLILIATGIGVVAEAVARILRLWLFRHWSLAIFNAVVVYGLIMGGVAAQARQLGTMGMFTTAAAIGLAYELANLRVLHFWRFPDERAATPGGQIAVIVVLSLLWGLVPMATLQASASLRHASFVESPPSPLEQINQRERLLLQKLDDLHARTKTVEEKLAAVRERKERLLRKLERRQAGGARRTPHEGTQ
ncbi:MAG: hypothetical protein HY270_02010 [Deltaproteobacteria bacterium]|nr:hypothetical protein [Deltaproteobacteria bacterium]